MHQHPEQLVRHLALRVRVRVRHGGGHVQDERVLHELVQLAAAERDVLEPLQLRRQHQRRDVDGELLRRAGHVRLPPRAAHLALVLVRAVEGLDRDVALQGLGDGFTAPRDVEADVHERVERVRLAPARRALHPASKAPAEDAPHEARLRARGALGGLGAGGVHAPLVHRVEEAPRELVRVLLAALAERLTHRAKVLHEGHRRHRGAPRARAQSFADVLAHLE